MRMFSLHRDWQWSDVAAVIACSVVAVALPLLLELVHPALFEPVELWTVDLRFQIRPSIPVARDPEQAQSGALVVIDYDDRAAHDYGLGRWPWDRRVHAQVVEFLRKAGARTVMIDLLFTHPSSNPEEDRVLVDATRRAGSVIYPVVFRPVREENPADIARFPAPRFLLRADVRGFGELPAVGELTMPLPGLIEAAAGLGHIQRTPDGDGVLRRIPFVYRVQGGFVPSMSLSAALRYLKADPDSIRIERGREIRFKTRAREDVTIPIDATGRAWINYAGPWGARFVHYPYSWLLHQMQSERGRAKTLGLFKGKTVVVSNLTTGSGDRVAMPFEGDFPTSEIHLHLLNMLLQRQFLRDATPFEAAASLGLPVALLTGAALAGGPAVIIPTYLAVMGAYLYALKEAFNGGIILPAVHPILAMTVGLILLLTTRAFIVDRDRMRFQSVLGGFLPPQTIKMIRENPRRIPGLLAGHSRELTIFFADIRGFSTFCKRTDPLQIQRVLRDYLTTMTVILRTHGGTLDKYMGDGIMAFFGDAEPEGGGEDVEEARVQRHAANAVRAGLVMQKKMTELNLRWLGQGQEAHLIRIGINTGFVTVGNLGTEYLWDYTVIGPEVNKAQRLESAAEPGGLLLSRRTYALARACGVLPADLPAKTVTLKGLGEEADLYAVSPEMVAHLTQSEPVLPAS
ncbi:MAG: adenylate/guanylate cyclase domain-containing protein [Nitrospirae bacterium]|nr:MAG: adenylate/guanylate cyclase domain-containing protein [Nitrospirota bacterium]